MFLQFGDDCANVASDGRDRNDRREHRIIAGHGSGAGAGER
jgi:hypothetical protein